MRLIADFLALSIGRTFLKNTEESYAEHPYLRGYHKSYYVELVPCYKIEKPDIIAEKLYPQVRKAARSVLENLERYDFKIYDTTYFVNKKKHLYNNKDSKRVSK